MRLFLLLLTFSALAHAQKLDRYEQVLLLMGSRFEIIAVSEDSNLAKKGINSAIEEIRRIEKLISSWDPSSQTSAINLNAGKQTVAIDDELFYLIKRCNKISQLTEGHFDISYASMDKIWKFDGSMNALPESSTVAASVSKINFQDIILDDSSKSVFLKNLGMKIGFGAIGKGYAANRAKSIMSGLGIMNGIINAGGDLISWGSQENGKPWQIAVTEPTDKTKNLGWLDISNSAVVTSGNYEKYVEFNGKRYTHIINPKTGYPAYGLRSVTIVCKDAEIADAIATSVFIMGKEDGLKLVNQIKGVECLLVTESDELIFSSGLELMYH